MAKSSAPSASAVGPEIRTTPWPKPAPPLSDRFSILRNEHMASNRGLAYMGPGKVEVQSIDYPKLALGSRKCEHGVILKIVSTNICGSDQHMVRGRTTAPHGLILGHEI